MKLRLTVGVLFCQAGERRQTGSRGCRGRLSGIPSMGSGIFGITKPSKPLWMRTPVISGPIMRCKSLLLMMLKRH